MSGEWEEQHKFCLCVEDPSRQQHRETDNRKITMNMAEGGCRWSMVQLVIH